MSGIQNMIKDTELFYPVVTNIESTSISRGSWRLDAQYYAIPDETECLAIDKGRIKQLSECCIDIYEVPPFVHSYVDKDSGTAFYTSGDIFGANQEPSHYLSPNMKNIDTYMIRAGQILMARSGPVTGGVAGGIIGSVIMVGKKLDRTTASDHVIRFTPNPAVVNPGYLCVYLMSEICRVALLRNASGSAIPAIRPASLRTINVPILDSSIQDIIGSKIFSAVQNKEQATSLLQQAEQLLMEVLRLPQLQSQDADWLDPEHNVETMLISSHEVRQNNGEEAECRLDAQYYNQLAQAALRNLKYCGCDIKTIANIASQVFMCNRFTRTYVNRERGVPFLSGSNIVQLRPTNVKYISKSQTAQLDELKLEAGWILITRSGTIGRSCLVWKNFEDWYATEDIVRVVANDKEIDSGYLYAFLSSPYGYEQILRFRHGSVIEHVTPEQIQRMIVPIPSRDNQKTIGDKVRYAYEKRAQAIGLEDEAQTILMNELTNADGEGGRIECL